MSYYTINMTSTYFTASPPSINEDIISEIIVPHDDTIYIRHKLNRKERRAEISKKRQSKKNVRK